MFKAPALWFPSTCLMIDDDIFFTEFQINSIEGSGFKCFKNPLIFSQKKLSDFIFLENENDISSHNLDHLRKNIQNIKKEKNLISLIISDLHMPDISGWSLFSNIESVFSSKILMSGFIKDQLKELCRLEKHVNIDYFLDKAENFNKELKIAINKAKLKFFINLSNVYFKDIPKVHPLMDTEFAKFFIEEIDRFNPEEIVTNNDYTRFVFKNYTNKKIKIITTADKNKISSQITSIFAETAPPIVLEYLSKGQYILCTEDDWDILPEGNIWPLHIRPAQVFLGREQKIFYNISERPIYEDTEN